MAIIRDIRSNEVSEREREREREREYLVWDRKIFLAETLKPKKAAVSAENVFFSTNSLIKYGVHGNLLNQPDELSVLRS